MPSKRPDFQTLTDLDQDHSSTNEVQSRTPTDDGPSTLMEFRRLPISPFLDRATKRRRPPYLLPYCQQTIQSCRISCDLLCQDYNRSH